MATASSVHGHTKARWQVPLQAVVITVLYCLIGGLVYGYEQDLSAVDAVYFCIVTMSTVGYGDISPETDSMRAVTVFWILIGIVAVFSQLSTAVTMYTNVLSHWCRDRMDKAYPPVMVDIDGNGIKDFAMPGSALSYYGKNMLPSILLMMLVQFPFAAMFVALEDEWTFGAAYYHCMVTASTVGYGDMSITTEDGRICSIFQIIFSVSLLGEIISTFDELRENRREALELVAQLHRKLEPGVVDNLVETAAKLHASHTLDAQQLVIPEGINKTDFVMGMLVQAGAVTWKQIRPYEELFDEAPKKSGTELSKRELSETVNKMQTTIAVAAGPEFKIVPEVRYAAEDPTPPPTPPPPTPPPPSLPVQLPPLVPLPPPVKARPTEADLEVVAREADAQLQQLGLKVVKLKVLERKIEVLKPIEFHGSKTAASRESGAPLGATLADASVVHEVCRETAVAIHVCNKVLETHDFKPFGLVVAGHTSGDSQVEIPADETAVPGYEISVNRAQAVCEILNEEMNKVSPDFGLEDRIEVEFKGYGCIRPLPGFDDGGNHPQNRRVEIDLLFRIDKEKVAEEHNRDHDDIEPITLND